MISQEKNETVSNILSDAAQKSYEKIKALIFVRKYQNEEE